jgi:hypothetical protein
MRARPSERSRPAQPPRSGCLDRLGSGRATPPVYRLARACRASAAKRPPTCGRLGDLRFLPPPLCRRERADGGYRDACSIARSLRGLLDACSIPRRGLPRPETGRATVRRCRPTPRCQSSTAPKAPRADLSALRRGCEVEASCYACAPSYHAGAAASFANRTAMQIAVSRQSGGAGSGGTPDKAGAEF